jgi:hypothetical protein
MGEDEQLAGAGGKEAGEGGGGTPEFERAREGSGGGSDAGWGTTNMDSGPGGREKTDRQFARRTSEREGGAKGEYHRIYAPRKTTVSGKDETTPFQVGEGPSLGSVEVRGVPQEDEKRYVPYDQVPRPYKTATEESLERAPIPREYRDAVRRYFDDEE